jgi:hypothetical protein
MMTLAGSSWVVAGHFDQSRSQLEQYTFDIQRTGGGGEIIGVGRETGTASEKDQFRLENFRQTLHENLTFEQVWSGTDSTPGLPSDPRVGWQCTLSGPPGSPSKMSGVWFTGSGSARVRIGEFQASKCGQGKAKEQASGAANTTKLEGISGGAGGGGGGGSGGNGAPTGGGAGGGSRATPTVESTTPEPVISPYSVAPSDTVPRLHVLPIGQESTTMVIKASIFSPSNPVFTGGLRGLVIGDDWETLSKYYQVKANGMGITDAVQWNKERKIDAPSTGVVAAVPIGTPIGDTAHSLASVLGFLMPSPYYSVANPQLAKVNPDDQLFHWASIFKSKSSEIQLEGTFCWQYVIGRALEPELMQEFHTPAAPSLMAIAPIAPTRSDTPTALQKFDKDLSDTLKKLKDFTTCCQEVDHIVQKYPDSCDGCDEISAAVKKRDQCLLDTTMQRELSELITKAKHWKGQLQVRIQSISDNWRIVEAAAQSQGIKVDRLWVLPSTGPIAGRPAWNLCSDVSSNALDKLPGLGTSGWAPDLNSLTAIVHVLDFYKQALHELKALTALREDCGKQIAEADEKVNDLTAKIWAKKNR